MTNIKWKISTSIFERVYKFVTEEQLEEIKKQGFIRTTITRESLEELKPPESLEELKNRLREVLEGKREFPTITTSVSPLRSFILESVWPIEFGGMNGYLLTINATDLIFLTEGFSSFIDEQNKIIMVGDTAWIPIEDISTDKIIKIEYLEWKQK